MNFISKLSKLPHSKLIAFNAFRSINTSSFMKYAKNSDCPPPCPPPCPPCGFYPKEVECKMNEQIALEFMAFYNYLAIFNHFGRSTVGLQGCKHFFLNCAEEEKRHALKLCNFQNIRGGIVNLMDIEKPLKSCFTVKDAFSYSLQMEKKIAEKLIDLKDTAEKCDDSVTHDFIVNDFIKEQFKFIHKLKGHLAKLELLGCDTSGIYIFDKDLEEKHRKYIHD